MIGIVADIAAIALGVVGTSLAGWGHYRTSKAAKVNLVVLPQLLELRQRTMGQEMYFAASIVVQNLSAFPVTIEDIRLTQKKRDKESDPFFPLGDWQTEDFRGLPITLPSRQSLTVLSTLRCTKEDTDLLNTFERHEFVFVLTQCGVEVFSETKAYMDFLDRLREHCMEYESVSPPPPSEKKNYSL